VLFEHEIAKVAEKFPAAGVDGRSRGCQSLWIPQSAPARHAKLLN